MPDSASATLPVGSPAVTVPSTASVQESRDNYLQRTISFLDPSQRASFEKSAKIWSIAAVVSTVAFLVLSVAALVASSLFAPASLPLSALFIFCLTGPAVELHKTFMEKSHLYEDLAKRSQEIQAIIDSMPTDPIELISEFHSSNLCLSEIKDEYCHRYRELKPLLATLKYWEAKTKEFETLADEYRNKADDHLARYPNESNIIEQFRLRTLSCEEAALLSKVQAAFYYGLVKNPLWLGDFDKKVQFSTMPFEKRALARHFHDPKAEEFLTVNREEGPRPFTFTQVKESSLNDLSQQIFS